MQSAHHIANHTHDFTIRTLAGAKALGTRLVMFHQVLMRHVFPMRVRQEPEVMPFTDGYEVSNRGRVRSKRQVQENLRDNKGPSDHPWWMGRVKRLIAEAFIPQT